MSENFIACKEGCYPIGGYCDQSGECQCNSGWSGTNCSVPDCPNECQNGACNVPNNCVCNDGWSGMNCTQPVCHQKCVIQLEDLYNNITNQFLQCISLSHYINCVCNFKS